MITQYFPDPKKTEEELKKLNESIANLRRSIDELNESNRLYSKFLIGLTMALFIVGLFSFLVTLVPPKGLFILVWILSIIIFTLLILRLLYKITPKSKK